MPGSDPTAASLVPVSKCDLDLGPEAHRFFRRRIRVAGTGLALGCAFVGIGAFEAGTLVASGFSASYLIAVLLVVLGLALIGVSLYSGLLNPVTRIRGGASGLAFERRWGRPLTWAWRDPDLRVDVDDRTIDPIATAEAREHLYFEGPGPIYGSLTPAVLGPLLNTARTYGASVSTKQLEQRERGEVHLVRRVRIRPAPIR